MGIMSVIAAAGLLLFLMAYLSSKSRRVMILLGVFSLFLLKAVILVVSDLTEILTISRAHWTVLFLDILIMGLLIFSGFKE